VDPIEIVNPTNKHWNWPIWLGFLASVAGLLTYPFFMQFESTRDFPWVNLLLFCLGLALLIVGLFRAFGRPTIYRGKIFGTLFAVVSLLMAGFFSYIVFYELHQLPASTEAPRIGQRAPEFRLPDQNDRQVSLTSLLTSPLSRGSTANPNAVLLVFYRGFW